MSKKHDYDSCPNCGYCKHCGRSSQPAYPWWGQPLYPVPHYVTWPYLNWPPTVTWTDNTTSDNSVETHANVPWVSEVSTTAGALPNNSTYTFGGGIIE